MSDDKKYTDPELEQFIRENRDMIERLLKEEKTLFKEFFNEEKASIEEIAEEQKKKAREAAQGVFNMFTDPEVQKHFMTMGMEFMMGMNALMRAAPMPDIVKDMAEKADEARKGASENFCDTNPDCKKKPKASAPEKIEIKSAPKKTTASSTKEKTTASSKTKTSD